MKTQFEPKDSAFAQKLPFDGRFSELHRKILRARRLELGLSLKQLGDLLAIHWSTIRKWEAGITFHCHPRHVHSVAKFFAGGFDRELLMGAPPVHRPLPLPDEAAACLDRLAQTYRLIAVQNPKLATEFLGELQAALRKATARFRAFCT